MPAADPDKGIYPSPEEVKKNLRAKLDNKRGELLETNTYLGDPEFRARISASLAWARIGYDNVLCTKESVDKVKSERDHETAQTLANTEYTDDNETAEGEESGEHSVTISDGNSHGEAPVPAVRSVLQPAILSVVVQITPQDFWMTSCGMWKGPGGGGVQAFEDMKLTCTGAAADHEVFHKDFSVALANLRHLMDTSATPGFKKPSSVIKNNKFKFRHVLFVTKASDSDEDSEGGEGDGEGKEEGKGKESGVNFSIENWPAHFERARTALKDMVSTHDVVPVPAYDMHGRLIEPQNYRKYLEGALVRVAFTLSHWSIGNKSEDTYAADIKGIRVLQPPSTSAPVTPRKRKVLGTDPFESPRSSPSKKSRA